MTSHPQTSLPLTSLPQTSLPQTSLPLTSLPLTAHHAAASRPATSLLPPTPSAAREPHWRVILHFAWQRELNAAHQSHFADPSAIHSVAHALAPLHCDGPHSAAASSATENSAATPSASQTPHPARPIQVRLSPFPDLPAPGPHGPYPAFSSANRPDPDPDAPEYRPFASAFAQIAHTCH